MKRTISVMLGKGSVSHNSREFTAKNNDRMLTSQIPFVLFVALEYAETI